MFKFCSELAIRSTFIISLSTRITICYYLNMRLQDIDENEDIALDLDDAKFVESREIILELFDKVVRVDGMKHWHEDVLERLIDESVEEIVRLWE